jgi:phosphonate transport system permease protein
MTPINRAIPSPKKQSWTGWLSIIIPGLGQFLNGRRWRGIVIFIMTLMLGYLVNWALTLGQKVGQIQLGDFTTSWLWLPFILFWLWNAVDAHRSVEGRAFNTGMGILCAAIILYVIAWNVTDVKLDRLVTRINDARLVATDLVNPDFLTINVDGQDQVCAWSCLWGTLSDKVSGLPAKGTIRVSDNLLNIIGRIQQADAPRWMVRNGLAAEGSTPTQYVAGTLIETIAMGLLATIFSTILAIPVSFLAAHNVMARVPGGMVIYYITRTLLNIVRAVDTIVWGLILIVWVGLGSFAGMLALTIHSIASLGKLFSEEIEHIDLGPVEAVTATGGTLLQVIRYAIIPQIIPPFLAYTLLRWDINMRSATVVGFVAGGGIGFFVVETIRMGAYPQYAAALWTVAVVIILVDAVSGRWRESILRDEPREVPKEQSHKGLKRLRLAAYIILGTAVFFYCTYITEVDLNSLFQPAPTFFRLVGDFISIDLTPTVFDSIFQQILVTVFQALLSTTLGALLALPFSFLAARNLTGRSPATIWIYGLVRSIFNVLRSIEAMLYVAIFVFWVSIGPFAGMLALAVTSFALIGKLFSEAIENIEPGSIEAVTATGAGTLQMIRYAILPQIVPPFVSYLIYQWDINIRMATIIGFAGGGGIGLTLSTYFGSLQYHKAGTVVALIVIVVALMDFTSAKLREKLV